VRFKVSVARREEKGSDVNLAAHLLLDVGRKRRRRDRHQQQQRSGVPHQAQARAGVPVGLVNPTKGYPAGSPNGDPSDGVGGHWWYQLAVGDLQAAQLPSTVGKLREPAGW